MWATTASFFFLKHFPCYLSSPFTNASTHWESVPKKNLDWKRSVTLWNLPHLKTYSTCEPFHSDLKSHCNFINGSNLLRLYSWTRNRLTGVIYEDGPGSTKPLPEPFYHRSFNRELSCYSSVSEGPLFG